MAGQAVPDETSFTAPAVESGAGKEKGSDWVIAPIPSLNPAQGFGLKVIAQYIFRPPEQAAGTPASVAGFGGFYTQKKSWGLGGGYLGHWQDDLWRPMVGGGYIVLNSDFYGVGNELAEQDISVPFQQRVTVGVAQLTRRLWPHFYAGLRLIYSATEIETESVNRPPVMLPSVQQSISTPAAGPILQWDSRDSQFYPKSGRLVDVSGMFNGGDYNYQIYDLAWNEYQSLGDAGVLAGRVRLRATTGDVPFYALSQLGEDNDLRGYRMGKYRDRDLFATQVEYRRRLSARWGLAVFAGVGQVVPSFDQLRISNLFASGGAGLRYRLSESFPVNFRLDVAYGRDGATAYLGVGEAF